MPEKMLQFTNLEGKMPAKRSAKQRRDDFAEIYGDYTPKEASEQASRCSQCGVPFCQNHCPLQNNIPDWLQLSAEGDWQGAYELSAQTNPMPEICGRICPQDKLCEGSCVIEQSTHGTVSIGAVERHLTDMAWENGWITPITPVQERPQSVGIIGAGPAGLAAAEYLRVQGWQVYVYDRYDRAGGLLIYGIPNFKLDKDIVKRRVQRLEQAGVHFILNTNVDYAYMQTLQSKHEAILLAIGVYQARNLGIPCALNGQYPKSKPIKALGFLTNANCVGLDGSSLDEKTNTQQVCAGKNVLVIGGGDTAMDCVRTAIRQGANSVRCLYRRDENNMPGSRRETKNAQEEGVLFEWLKAPKALRVDDKGGLVLSAKQMRLGEKDASGRQSIEEAKAKDKEYHVDIVIEALGFSPEDLHDLHPELTLSRHASLKVHPLSYETNIEGLYGAGDIVRGASLVVWAIKEGREAAQSMHTYLLTKER